MSIQSQNSNGVYIPLQEQSFRNTIPQNKYNQQGIAQIPQQQPQPVVVNQPILPQVIY